MARTAPGGPTYKSGPTLESEVDRNPRVWDSYGHLVLILEYYLFWKVLFPRKTSEVATL